MNKLIFCADRFGESKDYNRAVLNGYSSGFVKSASIVANGEAYDTAINEILPECQSLSLGVHLNIVKGHSLTRCSFLTDNKGRFNKSFSSIAGSVRKKVVMAEIEKEFRAQIEKVQLNAKICHINSYENVHAIPEIFELVCRLSKEYEIPYIRTNLEEFYLISGVFYLFRIKFIKNLIRSFRLNLYTRKNKLCLGKYGLKTNDYIVGQIYAGMMNETSLEMGVKTVSDEDNILVEAVVQPCSYLRNINDSHSVEFKMTQNRILEDSICRMGFDIVSHLL